jgi:mannose-6-phosphate isomerase-like protein (cupin superfamily)
MLEVLLPTVPGFDTVVMNDRFKCAFITHSDYYSFGSVDHMKRHNNTDEIFVLLSGGATMLTISDGEIQKQVLETGKAYNVQKGTWHYLAVTEDAKVFVAEASDTSERNTEVLPFDKPYYLEK